MKASVENKILAGFVASVAALMVIGWLAYRTTNQFITTDRLVAHTHEVIATLESGLAMLTDTEAKQRAFLLTGDDQFLKDSQAAQARINEWVGKVRKLTADNPEQQQRLARLESVISQRMAILNSRIKLRQEGGLQAVSSDVATLRQGRDLMDRVWRDIAQMRDTENSLLAQRQQMARTGAKTSLLVIVIGSALACAIGLTAVLLIHRDLKLRKLAEEERDRFFNLSRDLMCIIRFDTVLQDGESRVGTNARFFPGGNAGQTLHRICPPRRRPATLVEAGKLAGGGEVIYFENRYLCKDGSYRWLAWSARAAVPQKLMYATARDITERKADQRTNPPAQRGIAAARRTVGNGQQGTRGFFVFRLTRFARAAAAY